jgi:metal-dependent hydrolase (beta-lactamase superfamily II)
MAKKAKKPAFEVALELLEDASEFLEAESVEALLGGFHDYENLRKKIGKWVRDFRRAERIVERAGEKR